MLKEGTKAPAFKLKNDEGKVVSLSDFKGKKVVLYFYPKDNTPGCTTEACDFRDNIKSLQSKDVVVIGVSKDSIESHQKFKEKYDLPFMLLADEEKNVLEKYGVWKEKNMYGKKVMGIERTTVLIDEEGKIYKIFPKVKAEGHVSEVLKFL
jgi:peroxiredoxin Q/BCP